MSLLCNVSGSDKAIIELRNRLNIFYNNTDDYSAFQTAPDNSRWHRIVHSAINDILQTKNKVCCLEIGAGLSRFGESINDKQSSIQYHAHDITDRNRDFLGKYAQRLWFGDISQIQAQYDIIFHFFVFEHVSNPEEFLTQVDQLLLFGGIHIIICPRYDMPGYICPSLRHLSKLQQFILSTKLTGSHLLTACGSKPKFWVNTDPAMFNQKWYRDADAINLVSLFDIESWHRKHGYHVERCYPSDMRMIEKLLKVFVKCKKQA